MLLGKILYLLLRIKAPMIWKISFFVLNESYMGKKNNLSLAWNLTSYTALNKHFSCPV